MREMDDTYHSKTDNIDTQRLYLKVNLRVVSAVYPRDMTVTQQLHNKPNTNKLLANLPHRDGSQPLRPSSCKDSATRC